MTDMLKELEAELAGLKETLAMMARYAPAPGVLCAPTMEMGLGWKAKSLLAKIDTHHAEIAEAVKDAEIGRAYLRWYASAKGYSNVIADSAHEAIAIDAMNNSAREAGE
jgi:hypothetical protein